MSSEDPSSNGACWGNLASSAPEPEFQLSPQEFENVRSTLPTDGQFSSDGEFTAIATREAQMLGGLPLVKEESSGDNLAPVPSAPNPGNSSCYSNVPLIGREIGEEFVYQSNSATSQAPSVENWNGDLDFRIRIPKAVKAKEAQFSDVVKKLYIPEKKSVQVHFNLRPPGGSTGNLPRKGLYIRAVPIFTRADDFQYPVKVCRAHSRNSIGDLKKYNAEHLIRTHPEESDHTYYLEDQASKRHSVLAKVPELQPGSNEVSIGYKFMDLGSCAGGLNRRETAIIFTLEFAGDIIGRQVIPLRICTCPKRDMENEEKQLRKNQTVTGGGGGDRAGGVSSQEASPQQQQEQQHAGGGKVRVSSSSASAKKKFWCYVSSEENFKILKAVAEGLEKKDGQNIQLWNEQVARINSLSLGKGTKRKKEQQQQPEQQPQQQQQELQQHNLQVSSPAPVVTSIPFTNVSSPSTIDVRMVTNPNITVPTFSMDVENQDAAYQG